MRLVPCTPNVACTKNDNKIPNACLDLGSGPTSISGNPCTIYAASKIQPSTSVDDSAAFIVPFWLVKSTLETARINMQLQAVQYEYDGETCTVPCSVNTKGLKIGDELYAYSKQPSEKYTPFSSLKVAQR